MEIKTKTYECVCCKYTTILKANLIRHTKSLSHLKMSTGHVDDIRENKDEYIIRILKELEDARSLHKPLEDEIKQLKIKINKLQNPEKPIQIEEKPKEIPIKIDFSSRFS